MDKQNELSINDTKIKVTRVPFRCVVCNGWGTVSNAHRTCQACGGKGVIFVDQPERQTEV